jgi:hypothetical protein
MPSARTTEQPILNNAAQNKPQLKSEDSDQLSLKLVILSSLLEAK